MPITEVWRMDRFFARHPPVDLLVAAYLGYESSSSHVSKEETLRHFTETLRSMPAFPVNGATAAKGQEMVPPALRMPEHLMAAMKKERMH